VPQGSPSTSALSRHAIYQSFYLRSGAHAGAATPIAPPGRWPRITGRNGSSAFEIECVETPSVCACALLEPLWRVWTTRNCRRYCIHLMSPSTQTPTRLRVVKTWRDRSLLHRSPALARRLAQSNKDLRSRCCAARHASDRRSHPRTVPCSPLEGSAALYARRLRLSLMIVPLSQQAHARCGHAPFWARESTALRSLRQDVDKSISHHSRSHSRGGRDDHR